MGKFSSKPSQNRHPERSAYTDCARAMGAGRRAVEEPVPSVAGGTPAMLICFCCWKLFNHRSRNFERWGPNVLVTFQLEQALAAIGCSKPSQVSCLFRITRRYGTGRRWLKSFQQQKQISIVGVPSATLGTGSSTARHKIFCYVIDLRGASLRMTTFWRGTENIRSGAKKRRSKKTQALRMTILW